MKCVRLCRQCSVTGLFHTLYPKRNGASKAKIQESNYSAGKLHVFYIRAMYNTVLRSTYFLQHSDCFYLRSVLDLDVLILILLCSREKEGARLDSTVISPKTIWLCYKILYRNAVFKL